MKKLFGVLMMLCLVLLPMKAEAAATRGTCGVNGDNLVWSLNNGVLSIGGAGDMADWERGDAPWYESRNSIYAIAVGSGVTSIGNAAFYDCSKVTTVSIENDVRDIGDWAFGYCSDIQSITIPAGVTNIGESAFRLCIDLTSINIPGNVTSIGEEAFRFCESLTSITIPGRVSSIGADAFAMCNKLTDIYVDASNATYSSEQGVLFNKNKTILVRYPIGKTATTYQIPGTVTQIEDFAFSDCSNIQNIVFPAGLTTIGASAFASCDGLTSVTLPNTVTTIGSGAFAYSSNIASMYIPGSVSTLDYSVLYDCDSLTSVTIPNGVTTIKGNAVSECDRLGSISVPASATSISTSAFSHNATLTEIKVDTANPKYKTGSCGCLFSKDGKTFIQYLTGSTVTHYEIPNGVTEVSSTAFNGADDLMTLLVPNSVQYMYTSGFDECNAELALYGYSGSYADAYATNVGLPFYDVTIVYERFKDIPAGTWYTDSVQYVFDNGYMSGKSFNWFDAMNTLTRAEFVTTLYSIKGKPAVTNVSNNFSDVENSWYTNAVLWANKNGYVSGYVDGRFGVNDNITREQLALILYKCASDIPQFSDYLILNNYTDAYLISDYAVEAMRWAVTNGIMSGTPEGKLNPQGNATRAECAVMLNKYCGL